MQFERTGVILFTQHYEACVAFYRDKLELPVLNVLDDEHSKLTSFAFSGGTYLMIETGGHAVPSGKTLKHSPVRLRFNVTDVDTAAQELGAKGIDVNIRREVWGTCGDFMDPDGNICSFREERPGEPGF